MPVTHHQATCETQNLLANAPFMHLYYLSTYNCKGVLLLTYIRKREKAQIDLDLKCNDPFKPLHDLSVKKIFILSIKKKTYSTAVLWTAIMTALSASYAHDGSDIVALLL